jgi:hypothetical protein
MELGVGGVGGVFGSFGVVWAGGYITSTPLKYQFRNKVMSLSTKPEMVWDPLTLTLDTAVCRVLHKY